MWFRPIPVLLVAARSSGPRAFFVALVAWFLGSLNMWGVLRNVLQVPLVPVLAFLILPGCFFGLALKIHDFRNTEGLAMVQIRYRGGFETKSEAFT